MGKIVSIKLSDYMILVTIIILTYVEFSHSCHRRVEYHHFHKKQPHKGPGGGYHQVHGGGGHHGKGHGGAYGGGGHGKGHPGPYGGGGHGKGHAGAYGGGGHGKGHAGAYGGGGHGKGHGGGYEGGHAGGHHGGGHAGGHHGGGHAGGHHGGGHAGGHHGGGHGYGGGHAGYGGHGHMGGHGGHHGGVYGPSGGDEYGGGHQEHGGYPHQGNEGYGHGHEPSAYGHGEGHGMYGHDDGYTGHDNGGGGHGQTYGHGKGHNDSGQKGRRVRYQVYESSHYDDKGGHQPAHGYAPSAPHYMHKGYGYSGPYPNTEYSAPVETSVDAPTGPNSFYDDVIDDDSPPTHLDAVDTADLIRNAIDTKENAVVHPPLGSFGGHLSDSSNSNSDYNAVDVLPTSMKISASGTSRGESLPETKVKPSPGNFDLNINYNSDLPAPFRKNVFESPIGVNSGTRKKISSKYRDNVGGFGATSYSALSRLDDDPEATHSQAHQISSGGAGPDYLENDTGNVGDTNSKETGTAEFAKMNF